MLHLEAVELRTMLQHARSQIHFSLDCSDPDEARAFAGNPVPRLTTYRHRLGERAAEPDTTAPQKREADQLMEMLDAVLDNIRHSTQCLDPVQSHAYARNAVNRLDEYLAQLNELIAEVEQAGLPWLEGGALLELDVR